MPHRPTFASDMSPEITQRLVERWRAMTPAEKSRIAGDLARMADEVALAGLRRRFPEADERELWLRLVTMKSGPDLVREVYGWEPPSGRWS